MRGLGLIFQFWPFVRLIGWTGRIIRPTTAVLVGPTRSVQYYFLGAMYTGIFQISNTNKKVL